MAVFQAIHPIGDTDPLDLPVADAAQAARYYQEALGFTVEDLADGAVQLRRDAVTLRLAANGGDPEQASCYIAVDDPEAVRQEYAAQGVDISPAVTEMSHDGQTYRVIWVRDQDGICYCVGCPAQPE